MTALAERVIARFEVAKSRRHNWKETYREAQTYASPQRENFDHREEGTRKDRSDVVFDSTLIEALDKFASNLQSTLVPPAKKWSNLVAGERIPKEKRDSANKQLGVVRDIFFRAIHNSNFDIQVAESFLDLGIGTGNLMFTKGTINKPFIFRSAPLEEVYLERGPEGDVGAKFREHKVAVRDIKELWSDAKFDSKLNKLLEEKPETEINFVEATIPAKIKIEVLGEDGKQTTRTVDGFQYIVLMAKDKTIVVNREQESSPWIPFRWSVKSGEVYGRGPVLKTLANAKTLNKTVEFVLKNASMAISGAWTVVDDGVINLNTIQISPGAKIPVMSNAGGLTGPTIAPLQTGGRFDISQLIVSDLKASINSIMFAEPLGPIDLPVKTATEVSIRQQELSKRIGSAFGRLQFELIVPLVNRGLFILEELGLIDLSGFRVDGNFIALEHISPLAMAQDQEELMSMIRYAETLGGIFGPEAVLLLVKPDEFARKTAALLNVPTEVVPTADEFKKMKEQIAQIAAQAQSAAVQGQPTT